MRNLGRKFQHWSWTNLGGTYYSSGKRTRTIKGSLKLPFTIVEESEFVAIEGDFSVWVARMIYNTDV